ncbi:MAG: hypothetical protein U5K69_09205 [Balneolaceae bacterium]|nr:hypothetical protein [Balneolaceae bacterium]
MAIKFWCTARANSRLLTRRPIRSIDQPLRTDELSMNIVPEEEWQQIYNDAWRFVRDFFYDPNLHGVDWKTMKQRYQNMLNDAVTRSDVNYVIGRTDWRA